MIPYEAFAKWDGTKWKKRGKDYEIKKEEFAQRLLKQLYKQLPQLKGSVEYYEFSTPLTAEHFSNYKQGSLYGIDHNPNRFQQKFLKPKTKTSGYAKRPGSWYIKVITPKVSIYPKHLKYIANPQTVLPISVFIWGI